VLFPDVAAVHQARGMATRLTLRRRFWRLVKPEGPMQNFISEARHLAKQLADIGVTVYDEDLILVLTGGLPSSYDNFVISLDATPLPQLTLDYVVTRLLNEETRQNGTDDAIKTEQALVAAQKKRARDLSEITCFNCGEKGHFQSDCMRKKKEPTYSMAVNAMEDDDAADYGF
jgi:hypothetical protein